MKANDPPSDDRLILIEKLLGDVDASKLTASKTHSIESSGGFGGKFRITGFVLCNESGDRCIVEKSAVRWLSPDEMWWLMQISESPISIS